MTFFLYFMGVLFACGLGCVLTLIYLIASGKVQI